MTYHHLSAEEKAEIYEDRTAAFQGGYISEIIFRIEMALLGKNATEIEELVKFYRPEPPENDHDGE